MVNCNPETVSTDHGVSDRLYLEPVTLDAVLDICAAEKPVGVIAQLGGQTPLRAGARARRGRRPGARHLPGRHRPGRGPRRFGALLDAARPAGAALGGGARRGTRRSPPPSAWATRC